MDNFIKPAVLEKVDPNQYGTIPNSRTVQALVSKLDTWSKSTDGNGGTTRVILFDFRKESDLIDHHLLVQKLKNFVRLTPMDNRLNNIFSVLQKTPVKLNHDCDLTDTT